MRPSRGMRGLRAAAGLAVGGLLLAACSSTAQPAGAPVGSNGGQSSAATVAQSSPTAPRVDITPGDGSTDVRLDSTVTVKVEGGNISSVTVKDANGTLDGSPGGSPQLWIRKGGLDSAATYTVDVTAAAAGGATTHATATFHTLSASRLTTWAFPGDGATVGVGMPIKFHFNVPIPDDLKQGVIDHIAVDATPAQDGGWYWFSDYEAHYRPAKFWQTGTVVSVRAELQGVDAGNGYWGLGSWTESFTVGDAHVSYIDTATHMMHVYDNGNLLYTWPVSTGRPNLQTINGTLVVWGKSQVVMMDSRGLGIPINSPDGYHENVYWDTAISTDGFYVHSAPWSVWAQGHQNVSHGCVNLSPERATTFFGFSIPGDVVIVSNSTRPASADDGEGDWQTDFSQFRQGGGALAEGGAASTGGPRTNAQ